MTFNYFNLSELFEKSRANQRAFRGRAYPYKQWNYLYLLTKIAKTSKILELKTGTGLTTITINTISSTSQIDTIDMKTQNLIIARQNAAELDYQINFYS